MNTQANPTTPRNPATAEGWTRHEWPGVHYCRRIDGRQWRVSKHPSGNGWRCQVKDGEVWAPAGTRLQYPGLEGAIEDGNAGRVSLTVEESATAGFVVGQGVSWSQGSDRLAGTVVRVSAKTVWVVEGRYTLLNGADSGEADALEFHPGGFVGHTSGTQRYAFEPGDGERLRFSLRATGEYKQAGTSSRGTMRAWGRLSHGRTRSYDFNY